MSHRKNPIPTPVRGSSRRARVRPDHRAVDDQVFQIRVVAEMLMHLCPDALVSPTGESFVDAVPVPVFGWQQSPLGPRAVNP